MEPTTDRDFKVRLDLQVRFRDTDAMGHVNNAVYLTYLELARMAYWNRVFGATTPSDYNFILARVEIDYRSPAELDDHLIIGIRCVELRGASFDFIYRIWDKKSGRIVVEARSVQASYDYQKRKPVALPQEYRERILSFENTA